MSTRGGAADGSESTFQFLKRRKKVQRTPSMPHINHIPHQRPSSHSRSLSMTGRSFSDGLNLQSSSFHEHRPDLRDHKNISSVLIRGAPEDSRSLAEGVSSKKHNLRDRIRKALIRREESEIDERHVETSLRLPQHTVNEKNDEDDDEVYDEFEEHTYYPKRSRTTHNDPTMRTHNDPSISRTHNNNIPNHNNNNNNNHNYSNNNNNTTHIQKRGGSHRRSLTQTRPIFKRINSAPNEIIRRGPHQRSLSYRGEPPSRISSEAYNIGYREQHEENNTNSSSSHYTPRLSRNPNERASRNPTERITTTRGGGSREKGIIFPPSSEEERIGISLKNHHQHPRSPPSAQERMVIQGKRERINRSQSERIIPTRSSNNSERTTPIRTTLDGGRQEQQLTRLNSSQNLYENRNINRNTNHRVDNMIREENTKKIEKNNNPPPPLNRTNSYSKVGLPETLIKGIPLIPDESQPKRKSIPVIQTKTEHNKVEEESSTFSPPRVTTSRRKSSVVFCDCDGVLNTCYTPVGDDGLPLSEILVERVARICKKSKANLVLTSTWREDQIAYGKLFKAFQKKGVTVLGRTPSIGPRSLEVLAWLRHNQRHVRNWIILDDRMDLFQEKYNLVSKHLVLIDEDTGVTEGDVDYALSILKPQLPTSNSMRRDKQDAIDVINGSEISI